MGNFIIIISGDLRKTKTTKKVATYAKPKQQKKWRLTQNKKKPQKVATYAKPKQQKKWRLTQNQNNKKSGDLRKTKRNQKKWRLTQKCWLMLLRCSPSIIK